MTPGLTTQLCRLVTDMARKQVVYVDGLTSVISLGRRVVTGYTGNIKEALYAEAQAILATSREIVPYAEGALSSSGRVHEPFMVGKLLLRLLMVELLAAMSMLTMRLSSTKTRTSNTPPASRLTIWKSQ